MGVLCLKTTTPEREASGTLALGLCVRGGEGVLLLIVAPILFVPQVGLRGTEFVVVRVVARSHAGVTAVGVQY